MGSLGATRTPIALGKFALGASPGLALSRPPSVSRSQPLPGAHSSPPAPMQQSTPSAVRTEVEQRLDYILGEDEDESGDEDRNEEPDDEDGLTTPRLPPRAPRKPARPRRKPVMDDEDAREFLRFMSVRKLSLASLLNALFDPGPDDKEDDGNVVPGDEMISTTADSAATAESHTVSYMRARVSQWVSNTGAKTLAHALRKKHAQVLPIILDQLRKEAQKGVRIQYLRGGSASKTTITELQDFDPEQSARKIIEQCSTINKVLCAIANAEGEQDSANRIGEDDEADVDLDDDAGPPALAGGASRQRAAGKARIFRRYGRRSRAVVAITAAHMLLFARNERCNRWPLQLAVDLLGARVPRRSCELLARLGMISSYRSSLRVFESMADDDHKNSKETIAADGTTFSISWDNVNWEGGVRDKRLEGKRQMMAAVAGSAFVLDYKAQYDGDHAICSAELYARTLGRNVPRPTTSAPMAMRPTDAEGKAIALQRPERDALRSAVLKSSLNPQALLPGRAEECHMQDVIVAHAARAWAENHPHSDIDVSKLPRPPQVLPLLPQKTRTMGLPVLNLNQGSMAGNIAVVEEYMKFLGIHEEAFCQEKVVPVVADAFTVNHVRSAQARRLHDKSDSPARDQLEFLQPWSAWFHLLYTFQKEFLEAHAGTVSSQSQLSARILCDKVSMKGLCTGNIDFHDVDAYIKILFHAMVEAILAPALLVDHQLPEDAGSIADEERFGFLDADDLTRVVRASLHDYLQGSAETVALKKGDAAGADLLFLQGREMLRDAALYLELRQAVKTGDVGRVLVAIKFTIPRFAATGHYRYTTETCEMIHQVLHELPPALATSMLSASLVNHAGRQDSWLPADLDIEHQVFELKNVFRVAGANDVVKNGHIGQIISVLRTMRMRWYTAVGISSTNSQHSSRPIKGSVRALVSHFAQQRAFEWVPKRPSRAFELYRGDDVRRRRGEGERNVRQAKGVTTDLHGLGIGKLIGAGSDQQGLIHDWFSRRKKDLVKDGGSMADLSASPDDLDSDDFDKMKASLDIEELMGGFTLLGSDGLNDE